MFNDGSTLSLFHLSQLPEHYDDARCEDYRPCLAYWRFPYIPMPSYDHAQSQLESHRKLSGLLNSFSFLFYSLLSSLPPLHSLGHSHPQYMRKSHQTNDRPLVPKPPTAILHKTENNVAPRRLPDLHTINIHPTSPPPVNNANTALRRLHRSRVITLNIIRLTDNHHTRNGWRKGQINWWEGRAEGGSRKDSEVALCQSWSSGQCHNLNHLTPRQNPH